MFKALIIDDEPLARQLLSALLLPYENITVAAECSDGFEGFKAIQEHRPDLIFVDVQMPRLSGFEMLELIDTPPSVIFTTAFDNFALHAFEAQAIDYLLKPITRERFDKTMSRWAHSVSSPIIPAQIPLSKIMLPEGFQNRIVVKDNSNIKIIPLPDVHYIEACDDYIRVVTKSGSFLKKTTLATIGETLDPKQFIRIHRSYIMPVSQLARIEPYEKDSHIAVLHCGAHLAISKRGMQLLKVLLNW